MYASLALHQAYRMSTLHSPSSAPEWNETFNLPLRDVPTHLVLRLFDRDKSSDTENFLGATRSLIDQHLLAQVLALASMFRPLACAHQNFLALFIACSAFEV